MPYPTPIVEIAFTDGPYVVSPTWTDVSAYVREMTIDRGVTDDWTMVADGLANVVLSNRDRRFDPFNASGPYFGNLLPRRQIRIRATSGGTTYDVFRGFIAGWPPEWTDAGYDSTVTLSCFDALQLLGSSSMPADWAMPYIQSLSPRHYWEMDDPVRLYTTDFILRDRGSAVSNLTAVTTAVYQGGSIALGLPSNSIGTDFTGIATPTPITATGRSLNTASSFTISYWGRGTRGDLVSPSLAGDCFGGYFVMGVNCFATGDGYGLAEAAFDNGVNNRTWQSTIQYSASEPHHFALSYDAGTGVGAFYVDGFLVDSVATVTGSVVPVSTFETFQFYNGDFQQVAMFPSVLTQAQIQEIVRLGEAQYPETITNRVSRIIGNTPFSMSLVAASGPYASDVLSLTPDAPTAVGELTKVADSEFAPLFVNKAGTITQFQQNQIRTQSQSIVSQATYGGAGLSIGTDVQLQYDGDSMRNVANVEISYGGVYIDENTTSVNTFGEAEQFVTTQIATFDDAFQVGDIVTGWGGQVYPKASPVQVVLSPDASWGSTLGLELWDRFTLNVVPPTGSAITTQMLLTGVSHSVTPERWSTTVEGSARWAAVFILNTSRLGGTDLLG